MTSDSPYRFIPVASIQGDLTYHLGEVLALLEHLQPDLTGDERDRWIAAEKAFLASEQAITAERRRAA